MAQLKATTETIRKVNSLADGWNNAIKQAVLNIAQKAERISVNNYLSGPRPIKLDVVTVQLRSSIRSKVESNGEIKGVVYVSRNLPYAAIHEFGGMAGRNRQVRIPARPYLSTAAKDASRSLNGEIKRQLQKLTKGLT